MENQYYYYKREKTLKDGSKSYYLNRVVKSARSGRKRGRPKTRKTLIREAISEKSEEELEELYTQLEDNLSKYRKGKGKSAGRKTLLLRYYVDNPREISV